MKTIGCEGPFNSEACFSGCITVIENSNSSKALIDDHYKEVDNLIGKMEQQSFIQSRLHAFSHKDKCSRCSQLHSLRNEQNQSFVNFPCLFVKRTFYAFTFNLHTFERSMLLHINTFAKILLVFLLLLNVPIPIHSSSNVCFNGTHNVSNDENLRCDPYQSRTSFDSSISDEVMVIFRSFKDVIDKFATPDKFTIHDDSICECYVSILLSNCTSEGGGHMGTSCSYHPMTHMLKQCFAQICRTNKCHFIHL